MKDPGTTSGSRLHGFARWGLTFLLSLSVCAPSVADAEGVSGLRNAVRNLTRPVLESVRTVVHPSLRVARHEAGPVTDLQMDETGRFLFAVLGDGSARLWDLQRGVQLGGALGRQIAAGIVRGAGARLEIVAFRSNGSTVSIRPDGALRNLHDEISGSALSARSVLSADGSTVVFRGAGRNAWHVWLSDAQRTESLPDADPDVQPAVSRDGQKIAYRTIWGTMVVTAIPVEGSLRPREIGGCKESIAVIAGAFVAGGEEVLFGDAEGNVCLWRLADPGTPERLFLQEGAHPGPIRRIVVTQDGNHFCVGGEDAIVSVWGTRGGPRREALLKLDAGFTGALQLDPTRRWIFAGLPKGVIGVYALDKHERIARLISTGRGWAILDEQGRFDGPQDGVDALVWAGDTVAQTLPIDAFSESYFEPGLLRTLADKSQPFLNEDVRDLSEDGYVAPPAVSINPVDSRQADSEGRTTVSVQVDPRYPLRDVLDLRLYHNGKLSHSDAMVSGSVGRVTDFVVRLLPGRNTIEAIGVGPGGIEGPSAVARVDVIGVEPPRSKMQVLAIGIGDYVRPDWKLAYTRNDANAVVSALRERGSGLYSDVSAATLLDSSAKALTIEEHISSKSESPHDVLVVFFAGHGYALKGEEGSWEWYLLPYTHAWHTGSAITPDMIRRHGLSSHRLLQSLADTQAQRIFLILDSCRSGAVIDAVASSAGRTLDDAVGQKILRKVARVGGIHVLAASRADEDAFELLSVPHGALTYLLLEGIRGAADGDHNGKISVGELIGYATREMPLLSQRLVTETISQKPVGYSRGTDFELTGS